MRRIDAACVLVWGARKGSWVNEGHVKISRDQHVWSFDSQREAVMVVDPGTVIEIETWDCFTGQV